MTIFGALGFFAAGVSIGNLLAFGDNHGLSRSASKSAGGRGGRALTTAVGWCAGAGTCHREPQAGGKVGAGRQADHERICPEPNARNVRHTYVIPSEDKQTWRVRQRLVDPEEHNDWLVEFGVDLGESRKQGEPVLRLRRMGSLT